jgi:hypothetical protein
MVDFFAFLPLAIALVAIAIIAALFPKATKASAAPSVTPEVPPRAPAKAAAPAAKDAAVRGTSTPPNSRGARQS